MDGSGSETLDADERAELLERVGRKTATIGERIPDTVEIDGSDFQLREFVWEVKRQGRVPPDRRNQVQEVRKTLRTKRKRLRMRLETEDLTVEEGEELARTIIGIDRAITALKNLYETDLGERTHEEYVEGHRRFLDFIDKLTE